MLGFIDNMGTRSVGHLVELGGESADKIREARRKNGVKAAAFLSNMPNIRELKKHARNIGVMKQNEELSKRSLPKCPNCSSSVVRLNGKNVKGDQTYLCKTCNHRYK